MDARRALCAALALLAVLAGQAGAAGITRVSLARKLPPGALRAGAANEEGSVKLLNYLDAQASARAAGWATRELLWQHTRPPCAARGTPCLSAIVGGKALDARLRGRRLGKPGLLQRPH